MRRLFVLSLIAMAPSPLIAQPPEHTPDSPERPRLDPESQPPTRDERPGRSQEDSRDAPDPAERLRGFGPPGTDDRPSGGPTDDERRRLFQEMMNRRNREQAGEAEFEGERRATVMKLRNAPAADVAATIGQSLGSRAGVVVQAEAISNSILVSGPEEGFEEVAQTVQALAQVLDAPPALLSVDVAIVDLDRGGSVGGPFEGGIDDVLAAWKDDVGAVERVTLTTLENQAASVQIGANKSVASSSSQVQAFGRGGAPPQRVVQFSQRQVGTLVTLTGRSAGDEVLLEMTVERSKLGDAPPVVDEEAAPPETETLVLRATVRAAVGRTVLVGSQGDDTRVVAVLVNVRTGDRPGQNAAGLESRGDERVVKVFALRNASAEHAATSLRELLGDDEVRIAADTRTNSLVVAGDAESLQVVEALLLKLDATSVETDEEQREKS